MTNALLAAAPDNLPESLLQHLPSAIAAAQKNVDWLSENKKVQYAELTLQFSQLSSAQNNPATRLQRIRFIAGEWSKLITEVGACRKGCNHCCHIAVLMPKSEAKLIAKASGRKLNKTTHGVELGTAIDHTKYHGTPCTFLKDGACSVYASRPFVCRTLANMDDSPILCELVPGVDVPVPHANAFRLQTSFVAIAHAEKYADIREWFAPD